MKRIRFFPETTLINQFGKLSGMAIINAINNAAINDENSGNEQKVKTVEKTISTSGDKFPCTFPPYSFTQIED